MLEKLRVVFTIPELRQKIREAGLPPSLADRLNEGR